MEFVLGNTRNVVFLKSGFALYSWSLIREYKELGSLYIHGVRIREYKERSLLEEWVRFIFMEFVLGNTRNVVFLKSGFALYSWSLIREYKELRIREYKERSLLEEWVRFIFMEFVLGNTRNVVFLKSGFALYSWSSYQGIQGTEYKERSLLEEWVRFIFMELLLGNTRIAMFSSTSSYLSSYCKRVEKPDLYSGRKTKHDFHNEVKEAG
ncbi:hypothetical protein BDC45DRAFT_532270 [Circinella umbellata]|nr:hypothetical protein BDC45DRAFT_532270 [Circinella umbellata]